MQRLQLGLLNVEEVEVEPAIRRSPVAREVLSRAALVKRRVLPREGRPLCKPNQLNTFSTVSPISAGLSQM